MVICSNLLLPHIYMFFSLFMLGWHFKNEMEDNSSFMLLDSGTEKSCDYTPLLEELFQEGGEELTFIPISLNLEQTGIGTDNICLGKKEIKWHFSSW